MVSVPFPSGPTSQLTTCIVVSGFHTFTFFSLFQTGISTIISIPSTAPILPQTMGRKTVSSCAVASRNGKYVTNSVLFRTSPPHLHRATSVMIPGASSKIISASAFFLFLLASPFTLSCPLKCSVLSCRDLCTKYCPYLTINVAWSSFPAIIVLTQLLLSSSPPTTSLSFSASP